LPPYGLLVETGSFLAFVALSWNGHEYDSPVLFTLTSLENQPLACSNRLRVFHGFGGAELSWCGKIYHIQREAEIGS
jgi:hypothetical protein